MHGQRRYLVDRAAGHLHVARFATQTRAAALRARQVSAITAEKHPDVDLIFLAFQPTEETTDSFVLVISPGRPRRAAVDHKAFFRPGEVGPRHIQADPVLAARTLQVGELRAVM